MRRWVWAITCLLAALPSDGAARPGEAPAAELRRVDRLRTSDPKAFNSSLAALQAKSQVLSPAERRHLRLLQNFSKVLRGEYGQALGDSIALFDEEPDGDIKFRAGLLVANAAALTRDFNLGMRYLERSLALQSQVADAETRNYGYAVAGVLYNQYGQYALGLENAETLLAVEPGGRNGCIARQLRLEALHGMERSVDEAELQSALSMCSALREPIAANLVRSVLAQRWADEGKKQQAIALLEASLPEVAATGYTRLIAQIHALLARYKLDTGEPAAAAAHARVVTQIKGQDQPWLPNVMAHRVLYEVAQSRGDYRAALDAYRRYADADRAHLDDIKAREYAFQLSRRELAQKTQSIELLSNQNQLLRLQQEVAERKAWNFRLAIALLLVVAASAAYWGWRARRMHRNLRQLANTDGLTGLANRRHFRARTEATLKVCEQRGRPASVLLFDLDHFKQINDQCGHSSGDWVLREVAKVGRQHCREADLYGRIGGEEFAMTLVDCDIDAALRIAEQCRRSIEAIDAVAGTGCPLPVAASVGVVSTSISGYDYETLVAHADAAMYRSKVAGRNRVSLYQPPPVPTPGQAPALDSGNAGTMLREY